MQSTRNSCHIFEKYSNIKFHENTFSGSQVVACGQTDTTKLAITFGNFADAPNVRSSNSPAQLGDVHNSKKWQCTSSCNTCLQMTSSKGNILQHVLLSDSINIKGSTTRVHDAITCAALTMITSITFITIV